MPVVVRLDVAGTADGSVADGAEVDALRIKAAHDAAGINIAHPSPFIKPLVDAATAAFRSGLHAALLVSAAMILLAALVIALVPRTALAPDTEFD